MLRPILGAERERSLRLHCLYCPGTLLAANKEPDTATMLSTSLSDDEGDFWSLRPGNEYHKLVAEFSGEQQ